MNPPPQHKQVEGGFNLYMIEELGNVLMYYMDTLNKFKISSDEFSATYLKKFETNMKRDYKKQYEDFI